MKIVTLILTIILFAALGFNAYAKEFELNFKHMSDHAADNDFRFTSWRGFEVKYTPDEESLYYFASHEEARAFMASPSFKMTFTGLGLGFKQPVTNKVNLYGQVGYYFIRPDTKGRFACEKGSCRHWESLYYGVNKKWGPVHSGGPVKFNEYEIKSTDAYGITLGAEIKHKLSKNLELSLGAEYRAMSFTVLVNSWYEGQPWPWMSSFKGFSSTNYKVGLNYAF